MKHLSNVLYITTPDAYLSLEGETIVIKKKDSDAVRLPLHNLENIVCFNYQGVSPALMGACAERGIGLCFLSPSGRFLARVSGRIRGNVMLRKRQFEISQAEELRVPIAASCLIGKIHNARKVLERGLRDHALLVDKPELERASSIHKKALISISSCSSTSELLALEGSVAKAYFHVFNQLILQQKEDFCFNERSRRPPLDPMNSLLSFIYSLLSNEVNSALESVGLDPYVGFLHTFRPGRPSLALDLMEEFRPFLADRLALSLVNRRQVTIGGFSRKESGGFLMDDDTRKTVLQNWQERKKEEIMHPFLQERVPLGLLPYLQALVLARHLRGDLDAYPPFFWN